MGPVLKGLKNKEKKEKNLIEKSTRLG